MNNFKILILSVLILNCKFLYADMLSSEQIGNRDNDKKQIESDIFKFDKKEYGNFIKRILRTKISSLSDKLKKECLNEIFYLIFSTIMGAGAFYKVQDDAMSVKMAWVLSTAVLSHTMIRLFYNYYFTLKDENLKNLENFERYIKQKIFSDKFFMSSKSEYVFNFLERDLELIFKKFNNVDEKTVGVKKFIKFIEKEWIYFVESTVFGIGIALLAVNKEYGAEEIDSWSWSDKSTYWIVSFAFSWIIYYLFLTLIFDYLFYSKDPGVVRMEKLETIFEVFKEAKVKKEMLQYITDTQNLL